MHTRRKFIAQSSLAFGAFSFLKPLSSIARDNNGSSTGTMVTLLFTNGFAGNNRNGNGIQLNAVKETVDRIRRTEQHVLLVDSGNLLNENSPRDIAHLHLYKTIRDTGYDVVTPGVNDLQHGNDYFDKLVETSRVKAVSLQHQGSETLLPFKVIRRGSIKVGIIGIGNTHNISKSGFEQLASQAGRKAAMLKDKHRCQLVICLSHLPLQCETTAISNRRLAELSTSVDVVISAHTGPFIHNTHVTKNGEGYDVIIAHACNDGSLIGRLDFVFNNDGDRTAVTARQVFSRSATADQIAAMKKRLAATIV